jgi:hypothetical protein
LEHAAAGWKRLWILPPLALVEVVGPPPPVVGCLLVVVVAFLFVVVEMRRRLLLWDDSSSSQRLSLPRFYGYDRPDIVASSWDSPRYTSSSSKQQHCH